MNRGISMQPGARFAGRAIEVSARVVEADEFKSLRHLIWLYLLLWLIEGGLRRWILPSLSTPLLFVRDPLALYIFWQAHQKNIFPKNTFIITGAMLAILTIVSAMLFGHGNFLVALYGFRSDFLHLPLIFIIARVLRPKDLVFVATVALWIVIPYTLLMVLQYRSPQSAWVNRGLGGSLDGAGFTGANGHDRPPGTFSFITGPSVLYPMFASCWFALLLLRRLPVHLMVASAVAIVVAMPVSISRSLFLGVILVAVIGVAALALSGRLSAQLIFRAGLALLLVPLLVLKSSAFKDGMETFSARWDLATTQNGGFNVAIVDRIKGDLFGHFVNATGEGLGTGYSTNVGQKFLTEQMGFGASEAEWGRLICDDGLFLGALMIVYRLALACSLALLALKAWRHGSPVMMIFLASTFHLALEGQWGQTTMLGASMIACGLTLASARMPSLRPVKSNILRR